jgi:hypothetical protein
MHYQWKMGNVKTTLNRNVILTKDATIQSNYNEQYSSKNNIKVFNMKKRDKQNLREDFIDLVKKDLNVDLELRDVVAIHHLPSDRPFVMSSTKRTLFFKFFFARMTFLLASLLNSLTIIGFSPGRSEGKWCMATTSRSSKTKGMSCVQRKT